MRPFDWTVTDWIACQAAWEHRCAYCGGNGPLEQEHYVPLSAPDSPGTVPWNMLPACSPCNRRKWDRHPDA